MEKEFVPYELALRLGSLGFDEPCIAWYVSKSYGLEYGKVIKPDLIKEAVLAPLFQQAFRWFREKGYLIRFSSHDDSIHDFYIKWQPSKSILSDTYDTYEEAELACLEKLIEIVEQK
jgi:hypothetical protein